MTLFCLRWSLPAVMCLMTLAAAGTQEVDVMTSDTWAPAEGSSPTADVQAYDRHVVALSSATMEGRAPGTPGMERAKRYVERFFRAARLIAPFEDGTSFRQGFPLLGPFEVTESSLVAPGSMRFEAGVDHIVTPMGASGNVTAEVVFVGYGIERGKDGYTSFPQELDLTGKIAVMLRFEPMTENGRSRWAERGPWSSRAGFGGKLQAVARRGAVAAIIVNTPGADDARVHSLPRVSSRGEAVVDFPVLMMSTDAASRFVAERGPGGQDIMDLRRAADEGTCIRRFSGRLNVRARLERDSMRAENVVGLLRGRGALRDEYVVVGAHLDHLGLGAFGSLGAPGERGTTLHPGADDNASGCAAVLMLAEALAQDYAKLEEDAAARSLLFICFSGAESGLIGSQHYALHPVAKLETHALMVNVDMIGRMTDSGLGVLGADTGKGLAEFLKPHLDAAPIAVGRPQQRYGASDDVSFQRNGIPSVRVMSAGSHDDFHTPRDTAERINRVGAVHTVHLLRDVLLSAAQLPQRFEFTGRRWRQRGQATAPVGTLQVESGAPGQGETLTIRVQFGIRPGNRTERESGVLVDLLVDNSPADRAGLRVGDRLVEWNGEQVANLAAWFVMLSKAEPGDEVNVVVDRGGRRRELVAKLRAK
ncbi:MAG: M28 family peptidase [bacterium]|nr:M28 family peptidase [bacterium]